MKTVKAYLILNERGKPVRVFWSRLIAREEARYDGRQLVRCEVSFTPTKPKRQKALKK